MSHSQTPKPKHRPARISGPQTGWLVLLKHPAKGVSLGRFFAIEDRPEYIDAVLLLQELVGRSYVTVHPTYGAPYPQYILVLRDGRPLDPADTNRNLVGLSDNAVRAAKGYRHRQDAELAMEKTPHVSSWRAVQGFVGVRLGQGTMIGLVRKPKDDQGAGEE